MPVTKHLWPAPLRITLGLWWLYFSYTKWFDLAWVEGFIVHLAETHPIPAYGDFLVRVVLPRWQVLAVLYTWVEGAVGVLLVLGLYVRPAALLGTLVSGSLLFSFLQLPPVVPPPEIIPLWYWMYIFAFALNLHVLAQPSDPLTRPPQTAGHPGLRRAHPVRLLVGAFWLYFGYLSIAWSSTPWLRDRLLEASRLNPVPPMGMALEAVAVAGPATAAITYGMLSLVTGGLLLLGLGGRWGALLGVLMASLAGLSFIQPFNDIPLWFWFYALLLTLNLHLLISAPTGPDHASS
jgi:uncharacterized membrane protein YphA (DoxX/SURF4 family)